MDDNDEEVKDEGKDEIFVAGLPYSADEDALYNRFSKYGEVANVKVLKS